MIESDEWKERRLLPLGTVSSRCNPDEDSKRLYDLKLLSSFLPHEILDSGKNTHQKMYDEVCFMYIKICGVTQYSEECDKIGLYDPDCFLESLEEFLEPIIEALSSQRGDIIKLLPSEIWSIWKCPPDKKADISLRNLVHNVINCALHIQRVRDNYEIRKGVVFRVKIGISVGPFGMFKVDNEKVSHWIFLGRSLFEVKEAVHISLPGQILLSLSDKVELMEYYYITEEYAKFTKILGVGPNWKENNMVSPPPLIDGQFVVSSTSSEETIFNIVPTRKPTENKEEMEKKITYSDARNLLNTLPKPLSKCLLLGRSIAYLSMIQAIVVMHIRIDMASEVPGDNIDFIEVLIKTLCGIIHNRNGFLYRTKLGAVKVQIVFVFGNGDQKLDLDCKEALNNALGSFIAFGKLKEVQAISVAVTSGICYGGVINNTLRKAYILVSSAFKIASELVKLYPGKIVCDKRTKLHSRVREDQFVLLEYQPMKNCEPGPIFEYIGNNRVLKMTSSQEGYYPFLGNDENIRTLCEAFELFSENFKKRRTGKYIFQQEASIVVINGEKGQGKTKILADFFRVMNNPKIIHVEVKREHKEIPFYTIKKIFESALDFCKGMCPDEKTMKLKHLLENSDLSEFLCSLNAVLGSNFEETEVFKIGSDNEKCIILEHMLKRLAYVCFDCPQILAIDAAEYIDNYSNCILFELVESRICFVIMTVTTNSDLNVEAERLVKHKYRCEVNLENMNRINQTALACQILSVYAIPSELDRFLLETSTGNPGKIEQVIFHMLENNEIILKLISRDELKDLDLVIPPFRLTKRTLNIGKISISSQNLLDEETESETRKKMEILDEKIPICLLAPHFAAAEVSKDTKNDATIRNSFDGLTNDQKFVLQAASVLGEAFPRSMLVYIMNLKHREKSQMDIAEAIQGLFEVGILCCAKYQLSERRQLILKRSYVDISNKCDCLDSSTLELYESIPKYSFCQFLRFNSFHYKEVVRKMVPSEAAKEFHTRAIKYLNRETRRCNACGNGFMDFGDFDSGRLASVQDPFNTIPKKYMEQQIEQISDTDKNNKRSNKDIEVKLEKYPSFSNYNFSYCECEIILCSVYKQMVEHFKGLEQYPEMLKSIINYAEMCLISKNYENAISLLKHGLKAIQTKLITLNINSELIEAKMYTLAGKASLGLFRRDEACINFCKAMDLLGVSFPSGNIGTSIKLYTLWMKRNTSFYNCLTSSRKKENDEQSDICRTIACDLSGLFKIHKSKRNWKKAELCAIWSLTNSLEDGLDLAQILECITNMMKMARHQKNYTFCKSLEHYGIQLCSKEMKMERRDLIGVLKFYNVCFLLRFNHSKLAEAMHIGNTIIRMSIDINSMESILSSIPNIIVGFIFQKKIKEAHSFLRKMECWSIEARQFKGKSWYHISNLILQLETGFSMASFSDHESYLTDCAKELQQHASEKQKLMILMWLWYVRNEQWRKSIDLFREIIEYIIAGYLNTEKMGLYAMYTFEGVLLYLVQRSRDRNMLLEYNVEREVLHVCKKMESLNAPGIHNPRFTHLKAYHELYKNDEKSNGMYLDKALELSHQADNLLEIGWIEHSKRGWFNNLPDFLKDAWKENSIRNNQNIVSEKILYFTLPVPIN